MGGVTLLDWAIVVFVALLAIIGFARGFVAGALALGGFVLGAFAGGRIAPLVLGDDSSTPYSPLFGLVGAVILGAILAGVFEGAGARLQGRLGGTLGVFDGLLGAALCAVLGLGLAWVGGAAALNLPGVAAIRADVQRSSILQELNDVLPPSGPILNALARLDPLPEINGPEPDLPAPRAAIARDGDVTAARDSVGRIEGTACGLRVVGSGWAAGDGLIVTNAHVVAGVEDATVQMGGDGPSLEATAVAFDPENDVAVLEVEGLDAPALDLDADVEPGSQAAILGFPGDGPFDIRAGRVGKTVKSRTQDAYGRGPIRRSITLVRGTIRPGNSGGPALNAKGDVVTTIFAQSVGSGVRGGYGVPNGIVEETLAGAGGPVDTGPCVG